MSLTEDFHFYCQKLEGCLLPQHQRMKDRIAEVLDMDLIQQKVEHEAFDMAYYAQFVQQVMAQLCAPARDQEVAKIKEIQEIVPLFK